MNEFGPFNEDEVLSHMSRVNIARRAASVDLLESGFGEGKRRNAEKHAGASGVRKRRRKKGKKNK